MNPHSPFPFRPNPVRHVNASRERCRSSNPRALFARTCLLAMVGLGGNKIVAQDFPVSRSSLPLEAIAGIGAEAAPAVFARGRLDLDGEIDGAAWTSNLAALRVGAAAKIRGNLWGAVARDRRASERQAVEDALAGKPPRRALREDLAGRVGVQDAISGRIELPTTPHHRPRSQGREMDVDDRGGSIAWQEVRDVALRKAHLDVDLPAGEYRHIVVEQGTLTLGLPGGSTPGEYVLQSLVLGPAARIHLAGPVRMVLWADSILGGKVGNPGNPEWLDLRMTAGSLAIRDNTQVHGFILVSAGGVQIGNGAEVAGGVAGDDITIGPRARIREAAFKPQPTSRQPFLRKALRVQSRIPALAERLRHDYAVSVGYPADVPHVMLVEEPRAGFAKIDVQNDRLALLAALAATLVDTGFERAVVTVAHFHDEGMKPKPATNHPFTRKELEQALAFAGRKDNPADNIRKICSSHLLLNLFAQYCEEQAAVKEQISRGAGS